MIIGSNIVHYNTVSSTNTEASMLISEEPPEGTVITAGYQTSGRGLGKNTWESERDKNLIFSIILYPESILPGEQFLISAAISLGVCDFLDRHYPDSRVKWPNDIIIKERKIAGMLIENSIYGSSIKSSVAGIGININQVTFPVDLPGAGSLTQMTGNHYDLDKLMKELLPNLDRRYKQLLYDSRERLLEEYISRLYRLNKWGRYLSADHTFTGRITGVSQQGLIKIEEKGGSTGEYAFKEVTYLS